MSDRSPLAQIIDGAPWAFVASSGTNTAPIAYLSRPVLQDRLAGRPGLSDRVPVPEVFVLVDRCFLKRRRMAFDDRDTRITSVGRARRVLTPSLDAVIQRVRFHTRDDGWPHHDATVIMVKGLNAEVYGAVSADRPPDVLVTVLDGCTGFGGQRGWPDDNGCESALVARGMGAGAGLANVPRWVVTDHLRHAITPSGRLLNSPSERQARIRHDDVILSVDPSFPFQLRPRERLTGGGRSGRQKWGHSGPLGGVWLLEVERRDVVAHPGDAAESSPEWKGYERVHEGSWLPFAGLSSSERLPA